MADPVIPTGRRRGRPRGGASDARQRIIDAAVAEFGTHGYDGATMRGVAGRADVDAALVHHYFGTKADLFTESIGTSVRPARQLAAALDGDIDTAGARIARTALLMWEDPAFRDRGVAMMRAAIGNRLTTPLVAGFFSREMLGRIADVLEPDPDAHRRAGLVASQIAGVLLTRHVLSLPPMRDAPVDDLVEAIGPTLQRYLTGPLSAEDAPGG